MKNNEGYLVLDFNQVLEKSKNKQYKNTNELFVDICNASNVLNLNNDVSKIDSIKNTALYFYNINIDEKEVDSFNNVRDFAILLYEFNEFMNFLRNIIGKASKKEFFNVVSEELKIGKMYDMMKRSVFEFDNAYKEEMLNVIEDYNNKQIKLKITEKVFEIIKEHVVKQSSRMKFVKLYSLESFLPEFIKFRNKVILGEFNEEWNNDFEEFLRSLFNDLMFNVIKKVDFSNI